MKYKIYVTNLPSFYKLNLFNAIAKHIDLLVFFTDETDSLRNSDFFSGARNFRNISLARESLLLKFFKLRSAIRANRYEELIICGWDQLLFWLIIWFSPPKLNSIVIESSVYESNTVGIKGFVKKIFLSRISKAYCSGKSQKELLLKLNFKGQIVITKGVGVFNIVKQPVFNKVEVVKEFVYIGRLSSEKNLSFLIKTFNSLSKLNLHIIGFGPLEEQLKKEANSNIFFYGAVNNKQLPELLQKFHVFVLPSIAEPWGLVVEEALNNGLPVIVSNRVGCGNEIVNDKVGLIFEYNKQESLENSIQKMLDLEFHNKLRFNISKLNFKEVAENQTRCYY
jgi:glycosyltransferase involved in cell wall biosynthesis